MKEEEIRPQAIFDEYLRLAKDDTITYFADVEHVSVGCPACGKAGVFSFEKSGFRYEICPDCRTLYVNPRPVASAFSRYYTESPSSKYWATTFYRETAESRREKLWKPKALMVSDVIKKYGGGVIDVGGGYGLFAEEISAFIPGTPIVIEPGPHLASVCRDKGFPVVEKFLEDVIAADLPKGPKVFVSFELFEHLHDPGRFMRHLYGLMSSGDLFVFTTLSGTGADILALWEDSKSVSPPHHLNFFNPHSVQILLGQCGFEMLDVTTPGKLDIDILVNNRALIKDRFWDAFVTLASDADRQRWQEWLATSGWSSHMMVVCRKP